MQLFHPRDVAVLPGFHVLGYGLASLLLCAERLSGADELIPAGPLVVVLGGWLLIVLGLHARHSTYLPIALRFLNLLLLGAAALAWTLVTLFSVLLLTI